MPLFSGSSSQLFVRVSVRAFAVSQHEIEYMRSCSAEDIDFDWPWNVLTVSSKHHTPWHHTIHITSIFQSSVWWHLAFHFSHSVPSLSLIPFDLATLTLSDILCQSISCSLCLISGSLSNLCRDLRPFDPSEALNPSTKEISLAYSSTLKTRLTAIGFLYKFISTGISLWSL